MKHPGEMFAEICTKLDAQNSHLEQIHRALARPPSAVVPRHQTFAWGVTASGWTQIIPPNPNRIAVMSFLAIANAAVTIQLGQGFAVGDAGPFRTVTDNANAGQLPLAANSGFNLAATWPSVLWILDQGMGFFLQALTNVNVAGYVVFTEVFGAQEAAAHL